MDGTGPTGSSSGDVVKKKVELEVEVDTTTKTNNRFKLLLEMAEVFDSWRIFPRLFILTYIYLLYESTIWFMGLDDPNIQQAGLISVITGIGAAWFGLYVNSGKPKQ